MESVTCGRRLEIPAFPPLYLIKYRSISTSLAHFLTYVDNLGADIAISSHPFVDASLDRMEMIRECNEPRHRHDLCGPHNPFLIGEKAARRYFEIMDQCAVVQIKRQEAGLDNTGLKTLP